MKSRKQNQKRKRQKMIRRYSIITQKWEWRPDPAIRPRKITSKERAWLVEGLNTLRTGEYYLNGSIDVDTWGPTPAMPPIDPTPYLKQLDKLVVTSKCRCGDPNCHTIAFSSFERGRSATLVAHYTDDLRMIVICVHPDTDKLTELEVLNLADPVSKARKRTTG